MKQSSQLCVTLSLDKVRPENKRRYFKPKPLKSLSTRMLWILIESIDKQLENRLFLNKRQIRTLNKRQRDLSAELDERIEYDEYLCALRDAQNPLGLDLNISKVREADGNPPRKALAKVYIRGSRLRPGKKILYNSRRRRKSFV